MSEPTLSAPARAVNDKDHPEHQASVGDGAADVLSSPSPFSNESVGAAIGADPSGSVAQRLEQGTHNHRRERRTRKTGKKTGGKADADDAGAADVRRSGWRRLSHPPTAAEFTYRSEPVVYFLLNAAGRVVYVGCTNDLAVRMRHHRRNKRFRTVHYVSARGSERLEHIESCFIAIYLPQFNRTSLNRYGICWFPESTLDFVVRKYFAGNADLLPPRDEILAYRPNNSKSVDFHLSRIGDPKSERALAAIGIRVKENQNGSLRWTDERGGAR